MTTNNLKIQSYSNVTFRLRNNVKFTVFKQKKGSQYFLFIIKFIFKFYFTLWMIFWMNYGLNEIILNNFFVAKKI
jgi:hypothetical protein